MKIGSWLAGVIIAAAALAGCGPHTLTSDVVVVKALQGDKQAQEFAADPVAFLEGGPDTGGLKWCEAHVKDCTLTMFKKERMDPKAADFLDEQKFECKFKDQPFSVLIQNVVNPRGAKKALYVEGQNDNKMYVPGIFPGSHFSVDPRADIVRKQTLRYVDQFGFKRSLVQIIGTLKTARAERIAKIEVTGTGKIGGRDVLIFDYWVNEPKPTGRFDFPHLRIYLDRQWRFTLGIDLWDPDGIERGRYRFEDVKLNVGLTDDDFTPKANGM